MKDWFASQRILVPFDFSERSLEALRLACDIAGDQQKVDVQHVIIDWYPTHPSVVLTDFDEEAFTSKTSMQLEKTIREAGLPIERMELHVTIGDPGSKIAELAGELKASLVVIPSHGRRGITRLFLGSVAERVVRLSPSPVLVLKETESN